MLFSWIGQMVAVGALGVFTDASGPDARLPEPLVTQRTAFSIPFSIPESSRASAPAEVVLLYSRDSGANWDVYGRVPPEKGHFVFQAPAEGEYWFNIQSRDHAGRAWPRFDGGAGLRVRVDSTPPQIHVSAWRGEGGAVTARWRIDDDNLRPDGVSVAYRAAGTDEWHEVALGRHHQSKSGNTYQGAVTWWPHQQGAGPIEVRVTAVDAASNQSASVATAQADAPTATPAPPAGASSSAAGLTGPTTYGQPWPAERRPVDEVPTLGERAANTHGGAKRAEPHPPVTRQYQAERPTETVSPPSGPRQPEQVRPVNSRLFELEFDVDSADSSAISHVELWGTRDGGRTWRTVSLHQNGRSPILAKVDEEGIYGFRIVVYGRNGAGRKPQPGDPPNIWVRVDLTKPVARILSAKEGTGSEAGHLVITWTADDEELAEEPISLAYSTQRGGPWTSIAKRLPNTGQYAWPLPEKDLGRLFLRLEVRDAAGNLAEFERVDPVLIDRPPPTVRIRDVRPLGDTSHRGGPRRYIFR